MKEYQKIETVFERDIEGTKKLVEGKFRNPIVEYLKDNQWIFTEKIDGTNIRVLWNGHNFEFGGRTDNAQIPTFLYKRLQELFCNDEMEQMFEQLFGEAVTIICGEGYGTKIQKGGSNYKSDGVDFIVFDVMTDKNTYLSRDSVEDICYKLGLRVVPIIKECNIQQAVDYIKTKPNSTFGQFTMEGIVGIPKARIYDNQAKRIIVKIKVKDFN